MTEERFIELMGEDSGKWEGDNAYEGLTIIKKYTDNLIQGAGHDVIWSEDISTLIEKGIIEEDVKELRRLNWMVEDSTYLACFV
tara:strand:+ start:138 stop:389 length:252 start_codon:yes stop_codon:yes gene_type:complete